MTEHFTQVQRKNTLDRIKRILKVIKEVETEPIQLKKLQLKLCAEIGISRPKALEYLEELEAIEIIKTNDDFVTIK